VITAPASHGVHYAFTTVASQGVIPSVIPSATNVITVLTSQGILRDNSISYTKVCIK
jgi:hypothetical protein